LLAAIVAPRPTRLGRLDRLAVDDPDAGQRLPAFGDTGLPPQSVVDFVPKPTLPPAVELRRNRSPRREVMGQHPPGTPRPQPIQDGADEVTLRDGAGSPCFAQFPLRQQRPKELPLFVREIAGIGLRLAHAGIVPERSIANSL